MNAHAQRPRRDRSQDEAPVPESVIRELAQFFERNGYARWQSPDRARNESRQRYKKGDEIRLVANSTAELKVIRALLRKAGFHPGRAFTKACQFRQPLYGRQAVRRFFELIGQREAAAAAVPGNTERKPSRS